MAIGGGPKTIYRMRLPQSLRAVKFVALGLDDIDACKERAGIEKDPVKQEALLTREQVMASLKFVTLDEVPDVYLKRKATLGELGFDPNLLDENQNEVDSVIVDIDAMLDAIDPPSAPHKRGKLAGGGWIPVNYQILAVTGPTLKELFNTFPLDYGLLYSRILEETFAPKKSMATTRLTRSIVG